MSDLAARPREIATDASLASMAFASGSSDVIAFLVLGTVFTSAMTGNTALLGVSISKESLLAASPPAAALLGFVLGVVIATAVFDPDRVAARPRSGLRSLFLLEIACLAGFAVVWHLVGDRSRGLGGHGLIVLAAIGMGVQGVAARNLRAPGITTIVFTNTLLTFVTSLTAMALRRPGSRELRGATARQVGVFVAYLMGATIAGAFVWGELPMLPWLPVAAALVAFACCELARTSRDDAHL